MTSTPNITRNVFNRARDFFGSRFQQGKNLFDWDVNATTDQLMDLFIRGLTAVTGDNVCIKSGSNYGLQFNPQSLELDFGINSGFAVVNGRIVQNFSDITYNSVSNYIIQGQITGIQDRSGGVQWGITDSEKRLTPEYKLEGCVFQVLTGVEAGNQFDIVSMDDQEFIVSGDLSSVTSEDNYIILPPRLVPAAGLTNEEVYLVTWWEDISSKEENQLQAPLTTNTYNTLSSNALYDPVQNQEPSHRKQLRWCVYVGYGQTSNTNPHSGFSSIKLGTLERNTGSDIIISSLWTVNDDILVSSLLNISSNLINEQSGLILETLNLGTLYVDNLVSNISRFTGLSTFEGGIKAVTIDADALNLEGDLYSKSDGTFEGTLSVEDTIRASTIRPLVEGSFVDIIKGLFYVISVNTIEADGSTIFVNDNIDAGDQTLTLDKLIVNTIESFASLNFSGTTQFTGITQIVGPLAISGLMSLPSSVGSSSGLSTFSTRLKFLNAGTDPDIVSNSTVVASGAFVWDDPSTSYELESSSGIDSSTSTSYLSCEVILSEDIHNLIEESKTIPFCVNYCFAQHLATSVSETVSYQYTYADRKLVFIISDSSNSTSGKSFSFQLTIPYI